MNNEVSTTEQQGSVAVIHDFESPAAVKHRIDHIRQIFNEVMEEEIDYGVIQGCDKPSLYKDGANLVFQSLKLVPDFEKEDLSIRNDKGKVSEVRYRVTCIGLYQGIHVATGMGECSSDEEKYAWRKAVCDKEYDLTPEDMRRIKFGNKRGGGHYEVKQIATTPSTLANTILKMAMKRAKVDCALSLGASRIFTQDIEDLPEGYVQEDKKSQSRSKKPEVSKTEAAKPTDEERKTRKLISDKQAYLLINKIKDVEGITEEIVCKAAGVPTVYWITWDKSSNVSFDKLLDAVQNDPSKFDPYKG